MNFSVFFPEVFIIFPASECSSTEATVLSDNSPISLRSGIPSLHFGEMTGDSGPVQPTRITVRSPPKVEPENAAVPEDYQVCRQRGYELL